VPLLVDKLGRTELRQYGKSCIYVEAEYERIPNQAETNISHEAANKRTFETEFQYNEG